jgi:hypothetical protein
MPFLIESESDRREAVSSTSSTSSTSFTSSISSTATHQPVNPCQTDFPVSHSKHSPEPNSSRQLFRDLPPSGAQHFSENGICRSGLKPRQKDGDQRLTIAPVYPQQVLAVGGSAKAIARLRRRDGRSFSGYGAPQRDLHYNPRHSESLPSEAGCVGLLLHQL